MVENDKSKSRLINLTKDNSNKIIIYNQNILEKNKYILNYNITDPIIKILFLIFKISRLK